MQQLTQKTLRVNDADLYVEIEGEGSPLILLHGFSGSSQDWVHARREALLERFQLISIDARGHGRSTNPARTLTHRQCAIDTLAVLDELGIARCRAIGVSFGGNTLLHVATLDPDRIEAMVLVSATPYFPDQARKLMSALTPESQSNAVWESMRERHKWGDEQIRALLEQQHTFKDSYDDLNFTPPKLSRIAARTLIIQGDRDPLYPLELSVEMYRALPRAALCVVPGGGHSPIFLEQAEAFARSALDFFAAS